MLRSSSYRSWDTYENCFSCGRGSGLIRQKKSKSNASQIRPVGNASKDRSLALRGKYGQSSSLGKMVPRRWEQGIQRWIPRMTALHELRRSSIRICSRCSSQPCAGRTKSTSKGFRKSFPRPADEWEARSHQSHRHDQTVDEGFACGPRTVIALAMNWSFMHGPAPAFLAYSPRISGR